MQLHLLFSETPTCSESLHLTSGIRGGFLPGSKLAEVSLPDLNEYMRNLTQSLQSHARHWESLL